MKYLRVKNWERFQNYSDRRPPWIRLYVDLINGDDAAYNALPDALKLQLVHVWLLASRHDNKIPTEILTVRRLNLRSTVNVQALVDAGFVDLITEDGASDLLASSNQDAIPRATRARASASVSDSVSTSEGTFDAEVEFESLWREYPDPKGRKEAQRHFFATVRTMEDLGAIRKALTNYKASDRVKNGYVKNGSTWFNQWRDWVDHVEIPKDKSHGQRTIGGDRRAEQDPGHQLTRTAKRVTLDDLKRTG